MSSKTTEGIKEPVIRVTNGLLGLVVMMALIAGVGLADPLIEFLTADIPGGYGDLGILGTVSNGLVALILSFLRNEAQYSEFTTGQRILYVLGTIAFLAVFMSATVNTFVSSDARNWCR